MSPSRLPLLMSYLFRDALPLWIARTGFWLLWFPPAVPERLPESLLLSVKIGRAHV